MLNKHPGKNQLHLFDRQTLKIVADFCREYHIAGLFLTYAFGTFMLVMRNLATGFPFSALSIIQYAIIIFYATLVIAPLIVINIVQQEAYRKQPRLRFFGKLKLIIRLTGREYIVIVCLAVVLWTVFLGNVILALLCVLPVYIITPFIGIFHGTSAWLVRVVIYSAVAWLVILQIPISAGGFKALPVTFCTFASEECQIYTYFGEANGLYQFRDNNDVILVPIDSGYIRYSKDLAH